MGKTFIDQSVYDSLFFLAVQLLGLQAAIVAVEYIESDASTSHLQLHPLLNLAAHLAYGRAKLQCCPERRAGIKPLAHIFL